MSNANILKEQIDKFIALWPKDEDVFIIEWTDAIEYISTQEFQSNLEREQILTDLFTARQAIIGYIIQNLRINAKIHDSASTTLVSNVNVEIEFNPKMVENQTAIDSNIYALFKNHVFVENNDDNVRIFFDSNNAIGNVNAKANTSNQNKQVIIEIVKKMLNLNFYVGSYSQETCSKYNCIQRFFATKEISGDAFQVSITKAGKLYITKTNGCSDDSKQNSEFLNSTEIDRSSMPRCVRRQLFPHYNTSRSSSQTLIKISPTNTDSKPGFPQTRVNSLSSSTNRLSHSHSSRSSHSHSCTVTPLSPYNRRSSMNSRFSHSSCSIPITTPEQKKFLSRVYEKLTSMSNTNSTDKQTVNMMNKNQTISSSEPKIKPSIDQKINLTSAAKSLEEGAYCTQGSYLRWVQLQVGLPMHLLIDCILEQICFALVSLNKEDYRSATKYMSRALNTFTSDDLKEIAITDSVEKQNLNDSIKQFIKDKKHNRAVAESTISKVASSQYDLKIAMMNMITYVIDYQKSDDYDQRCGSIGNELEQITLAQYNDFLKSQLKQMKEALILEQEQEQELNNQVIIGGTKHPQQYYVSNDNRRKKKYKVLTGPRGGKFIVVNKVKKYL